MRSPGSRSVPLPPATVEPGGAGDFLAVGLVHETSCFRSATLADDQTMRDGTISFLDPNELGDEVGRTFRAIPQEVEPITANLSIANLDFIDFADNADADGMFLRLSAGPPKHPQLPPWVWIAGTKCTRLHALCPPYGLALSFARTWRSAASFSTSSFLAAMVVCQR